MTRWGKAGVRLADGEVSEGARRRQIERNRDAEVLRRHCERAEGMWRAGMVVPDRITMALDAKGLEGPEVDVACGAVEPAVDQWEAGDLYPSWEQLRALAALTGVTPAFFMDDTGRHLPDGGSLRFHAPDWRPPARVYQFTPAALAWAAAEHGVTP